MVPSKNPPAAPDPLSDSDFVAVNAEYDCDIEYPSYSSKPGSEIGQNLYDELSRREGRWDDAEILAVLIVLLLSAPRVWYFLLDRLAEISAAIRGTRS